MISFFIATSRWATIIEIKMSVCLFFRPGVILGVTNPFFAKTLQHWPHMVRIGEMANLGELIFQCLATQGVRLVSKL